MANLNLQDKKFITPENLKLIINYGLGFASRVKNLEDKEIAPFEADKLYTKDSLTIYDGYIYKAKVTNQSPIFHEVYWDKIGDDITELTKSDVEAMVGLSAEEIETLSKIILDSEIRLDKTFSSSKIYTDIQNAIQTSKDYTLTELSKMSGASYKVVTSAGEMTSESIIYLLANATNYDMYIVEEDGTATKIGDTAINLDNYFTKTEITDNYYDKVTSDGKYALITTVDNHISDTVAHVTQAEKDSYVKKTDIVDNLTSTDTNKPLSANQGKVLEDNKLDKTTITTTINSSSTDTQVPSAKASYNITKYNTIDFVCPADKSPLEFALENTTRNKIIYFRSWENNTYDNGVPYASYIAIKHHDPNYLTLIAISSIYRQCKINNYQANKWVGWQEIYYTSVADVDKTTITPASSNITGTIKYTVKNDTCYVSFKSVKSTTNGTFSISTTMPKPDISCSVGIINDVGNYITGCAYIDENTTQLKATFYNNAYAGSCSFSYPVAES